MLSDDHFHPLNLEDDLDEATDSDAVLDLLLEALNDPRVRGDRGVIDYAAELAESCAETDRQREAIAALNRLGELEPKLRGPLTAPAADLRAQCGEHDLALRMLQQRHAELEQVPPDQRDLSFYAYAALTAGVRLGATELAASWASQGARLAQEGGTETEASLTFDLLLRTFAPDHQENGQDPVRDAAGLAAEPQLAPSQPSIYRMAYLPESEYAAARQQDLLDATAQPRHEDYRRELQRLLESYSQEPGKSVVVMPLDVAGLLEYAAEHGKDPASRSTRLAYCGSVRDGREIAWPPERNAACWCGSARKYKKCCGAPAFRDAEIPDPASLVLTVELDHVRPAVWRRLAVPSQLRLDHLHEVIQQAMGWENEHLYEFTSGEHIIPAPEDEEGEQTAADQRLIALANEVGAQFQYHYDFGDDWTHTVRLTEIREAREDNAPCLLESSGACPPEDCGGPGGYMSLLAALDDPADPEHEHALDWLGPDYDPGRAAPARIDAPVPGRSPRTLP